MAQPKRSLAEIDAELQALGVDPSLLAPAARTPTSAPAAAPPAPQAAQPASAPASAPLSDRVSIDPRRLLPDIQQAMNPPSASPPPTFASTIPAMVLAAGAPMAARLMGIGAKNPLVSRTIASLVGALGGALAGHGIQAAQGVPGPSLGRRAATEGGNALLGSLIAEPLGAGARRAAASYGVVPGAGEAISDAERLGMAPSARGLNPSARLNALQRPPTTRTLAEGQASGATSFLGDRYTAAESALQRATARQSPNLPRVQAYYDWLSNNIEQTFNTPTGIPDLPALGSTWRDLGAKGQRALVPDDTLRALHDRFFAVAERSVEAGDIARGKPLGYAGSKWQPVAAVLGAGVGIAGAASGSPGIGAAGGSATFLGTTAAVTAQPYVVSWMMRRPWGVRWLTGALAASNAGRLTGATADGLTRLLVEKASHDFQRGDVPEPPATQTPAAGPATAAAPTPGAGT